MITSSDTKLGTLSIGPVLITGQWQRHLEKLHKVTKSLDNHSLHI